ncbi:SDR family NAD(P)-dependent oxidoreductase [Kribbella sp. NPDC050820]|uniref:SDR family NAD(P)-dependent oxidoreductase n=1 Tax=Kribbella sp. NPDC050820 TaxID=3155408 RepID=UPI0033C22521
MRAVITGASGGIGAAIAERLAREGMSVVMVGRDQGRLSDAARRIEATVPGADLRPDVTDLSLMADVRRLAERLGDEPPDVVISNAAVVAPIDDVTSEGLQRLLATNHLAPYLLLRSLAEALGDRPARFIVVGASPTALRRVPVDVDQLDSRESLAPIPSFRPFAAYGRTKNMNAMFVYALARRLAGRAITVNGAHPGIIRDTGLGRDAHGLLRLSARILDRFCPGPEVGADTPAWLATSRDVATTTGTFYVKRQAVPTAPHTTDESRCDRLWDESARLVDAALRTARPSR